MAYTPDTLTLEVAKSRGISNLDAYYGDENLQFVGMILPKEEWSGYMKNKGTY